MIRVQAFGPKSKLADLEWDINHWLALHNDIKVIDIKYQDTDISSTALLIYKWKENN